jgi:hypothetical protein
MKKTVAFLLVALMGTAAMATQKDITVKFKRGESSASYHGSVRQSEAKQRGEQHDIYTLGASKGQVMSIDVTATGPVRIYIWKDDFNQGFICDSQADKTIHMRLQLPSNGNYKVNVDRGTSEAEIDYDIKFSIR